MFEVAKSDLWRNEYLTYRHTLSTYQRTPCKTEGLAFEEALQSTSPEPVK